MDRMLRITVIVCVAVILFTLVLLCGACGPRCVRRPLQYCDLNGCTTWPVTVCAVRR